MERIKVNMSETNRIRHLLSREPKNEAECFGEDERIVYTATFPDGCQMDIKMCGVQYEEGGCNLPWTEAVLFDKMGFEIGCSEPNDEFFGFWEVKGYKVVVIPEKAFTPFAVVSNYSFADPQVDLFATYEDAKAYLDATAKEELRIDVEENGWDSRLERLSEDGYRLETQFRNHTDVTEFGIACGVRFHDDISKLKPDELRVQTPAGTIVATKSIDPGAPGIDLCLIPKGESCHISLAMAEVKVNPEYQDENGSAEDLALYVYANKANGAEVACEYGEDADCWSHRIDFKRENVLKTI